MQNMQKMKNQVKKTVSKVKKTANQVAQKVKGDSNLNAELKKLQSEYASLKKEIKNTGEDKAADLVGSVSKLITNVRRRLKSDR